MRELYMTDEEIARNFRAAADKKAQVKILADLNAVDKNVIHNKLLSLGLIDGELLPEKSKGGRPKTAEIDEAEARKLIEKDVPDEQIAKHFGVGISTFTKWRRDKGILRYPKKKGARKTVEEVQKMSVPILDVKQREETPMPAEKMIEQLPKDVLEKNVENLCRAVSASGEEPEAPAKQEKNEIARKKMTVEQLTALFGNVIKEGMSGEVEVTVGGKAIRGVTVNLRYDAEHSGPAGMTVELEV